MRRVLVLTAVAVVFSLPWSFGNGPTRESVAAADVAAVTTSAPTEFETPQPAQDPGAVARARRTTIPIPVAARPSLDLPRGSDYWTFVGKGLPDDFIDRVLEIEGVTAALRYTAGTMHLVESAKLDGTTVDATTPGWFIPLDGAIVELDDLTTYVGADLGLTADDVVLGERAAAFRGLAVGDTMTFGSGATLNVGAIIPDDVFGESEIIGLSVDRFDPTRFKTRAALIRFTGSESELRAALADVYGDDINFGLHRRNAYADHGPRIVRGWVFMKETFGEFEYRPRAGVAVQIDPEWVAANIVEVDLPLLGRTKCHRKYAATLTDVMNRLIDEGNADVINRSTFYGCWNPRYIRGTTRLSRHSFGVAADINFSNPNGNRRGSPTHSALLHAMADLGVHSGHVWTNADPGHFEYYGFPNGRPLVDGPR